MSSTTPAAPEDGASSPLYQSLRALGFLVLVLILVSMIYAGWIAIENWSGIQV